MWLARSKSGVLHRFERKPIYEGGIDPHTGKPFDYWTTEDGKRIFIEERGREVFPEVTYENSPKEVIIHNEFLEELKRTLLEDSLESFEEWHNYQNNPIGHLFYYQGPIRLETIHSIKDKYFKLKEEVPFDEYHLNYYLMVDRNGNELKCSDLTCFRRVPKISDEYKENNFE